jgi:ribosome-associated heat shock protein Hsp15
MNKKTNNKVDGAKESVPVRLDKWLWACRFFKTRTLAKTAIDGGKVEYQGSKPKPGRAVQLGDRVKVKQGYDDKTVIVKGLSERRQSASIAQELYQETNESINKRLEISNLRKLAAPSTQGKPDKKQRRQIHRFKNIMNEDTE